MTGGNDEFLRIKKPMNLNNLNDLEKKHLPVITAPDSCYIGEAIRVSIEVGKLLAHPNDINHRIEYVDLYEDSLFLARIDFPIGNDPKIKIELAVKSKGLLRAVASCNEHGKWESSKQIKIN